MPLLPPQPRTLSLDSAPITVPEALLALAGGKGANLARLVQSGYPVPDGFLITTPAYEAFTTANGLAPQIQAALPAGAAEAQALETAAAQIRAAFSAGRVPDDLAAEILAAYHHLGSPAVAVRSSATAEDLPEMSFAGQQDTYLNVLGEEALLRAVVNCWASLWTARAIGYRTRNQVPHTGIALAVVVQRMVDSQASGVLFTANPLTGLRTQTVIDAAFGLGEALVSGQVEPDHYVVDTARGQIIEKRLGAKTISIHSRQEGGTQTLEETRKDRQALSDAQILDLVALGQRVASQYGAPQDIEWALEGERLVLLQTRAITSLYPTPAALPPEPLRVMFSFAAVQGMLDPLTPLGIDMLKTIMTVGPALYGIRVTDQTQRIARTAGERLWLDITPVIRNSVGRKVARTALGMVEPAILQSLLTFWDDPRLLPERQGISPGALRTIARFAFPMAANMLKNMRAPAARRQFIVDGGEQVLDVLRNRCVALTGAPRGQLVQLFQTLDEVVREILPGVLLPFVSGVGAAMASLNFLRHTTRGLPPRQDGRDWNDLVLEVTRGMPHNPTTEMDLALWDIARAIQNDPALMREFTTADAHSLAAAYQVGGLSSRARALMEAFLARYGDRGVAEIDAGRMRWKEDPTHILEMLSSYLQITDSRAAPDVVFTRGAESAQAALEQICAALRQTRGGWFKEKRARFFAGRVRQLMGLRESPKFFLVRVLGRMRGELLRIGAELVRSGDLDRPDDLFFLTRSELAEYASGQAGDWPGCIAAHRAVYRRECARRQVPRLLLSDGRAFYEGMRNDGAAEGTLTGSPVSPGSVEGRVRVVFNPRQANLIPGEILVCPGTDPSWTPLFLSAAGLVMEVGGMMTHGAVVAREYGIPAIVGVDQATERLKTGQRIRIDGSSGAIQLLEDGPAQNN